MGGPISYLMILQPIDWLEVFPKYAAENLMKKAEQDEYRLLYSPELMCLAMKDQPIYYHRERPVLTAMQLYQDIDKIFQQRAQMDAGKLFEYEGYKIDPVKKVISRCGPGDSIV